MAVLWNQWKAPSFWGWTSPMTWRGITTPSLLSWKHSNASTSCAGLRELILPLQHSPPSTGVPLRASSPTVSQFGMAAALLLNRRPYRGWWEQQRSPDQPNHPSKTYTLPAATQEPSTSSSDHTHPSHGLFILVRSGKCYISMRCRTIRHSFFPQAIRLLNSLMQTSRIFPPHPHKRPVDCENRRLNVCKILFLMRICQNYSCIRA